MNNKSEMRKELAALSFTEKIGILEKLRDRSSALAAAGLRLNRDGSVQPANVQTNDVARLVSHIKATIDLVRAAKGPPSYWASLPLCIIDSVFSIRAKYPTVVRVVDRWRLSQEPPWEGEIAHKPTSDSGPTVREFLDVIELRLARGITYAELFGNLQRTSSRSGILKAEATHLFAKALFDSGINTFTDARNRTKLDAAEMRVKEIRGQGSGITFKYLLMQAGEDNYVKADTHLRRFASDALHTDWKHLLSGERTEELVKAACVELKSDYPELTPVGLDHAIWSYQRKQTRPFVCEEVE
jgi:hypothetical protein